MHNNPYNFIEKKKQRVMEKRKKYQ